MTILLALIGLGFLVFIHELGHFIAAKASKIKVLEFAIGMGPKLFSFKKGDTLYSLRLLPIGGFTKMEGEDEASTDKGAFNNASLKNRTFVVVAGAIFNLILGIIILFSINVAIKNFQTNTVGTLVSGYPAEQSGILPGDKIVNVNGARINTVNDLRFELNLNTGENTSVTVIRNGEHLTFDVAPVTKEGIRLLGIEFSDNKSLWQLIKNSFCEFLLMIKMIFVSFAMLFRGLVSVNELSGPVGIVTEISNSASYGFLSYLNILSLITINLGIFNLLPIPALDGGRLVFLIWEALTKKQTDAKKEGLVHFVGLVILLIIMVLVTSNDIRRIFDSLF